MTSAPLVFSVALVLPSHGLLAAVIPVTVRGLAVIVPEALWVVTM